MSFYPFNIQDLENSNGKTKWVINEDKHNRLELWVRRDHGELPWEREVIFPGYIFEENMLFEPTMQLLDYVGTPPVWVPPVNSDDHVDAMVSKNQWRINGRHEGDNIPTKRNFQAANEKGSGGIDIVLSASLAEAGDYVAVHLGDQYAWSPSRSPNFRTLLAMKNSVNVKYLVGLVGAGNKASESDNFTTPDDGFWFEIDTETHGDAKVHARAYKDGTPELDIEIEATGAATHMSIAANDSGDTVVYYFDDAFVASHSRNLTIKQLQPYFAIANLAPGAPASDLKMDLRRVWMNWDDC